MRAVDTAFTLRDWNLLPEGFPAQLVDGELVKEPAPTYGHQRLAARIRHLLVALAGPDRVPDGPNDVVVDDVNVFQPDIVVLRAPVADERSDVGIPLLVLEVLSPSTCDQDLRVTPGHLLGAGVEEVWLIDPSRGTVERRSTDGALCANRGGSLPSRALPGFTVEPATLFGPPASAG